MNNLTDILVSQMLNSLDSTPVNPSREEKYFAHLICKNLTDLGETGLAILNKLESKNYPIDDLPDGPSVKLCQKILQTFYQDEMFVEDPEYGFKPNWKVVINFDQSKSETAYQIYRAMKQNIVGKSNSISLQEAVRDRNKIYFIENFESIFKDIPFKDALNRFKNFLSSEYVEKEDQDYVWEFFETLMDIFIYEEENLIEISQIN